MITKTILGATAAAFIGAGTLGASTTTASATGIYIGGPGFQIGYGHKHGHKVCKPIFKKVKWQDYYGHWHTKVKIVDYKCWWKGPKWGGNGNWGGYGGWGGQGGWDY